MIGLNGPAWLATTILFCFSVVMSPVLILLHLIDLVAIVTSEHGVLGSTPWSGMVLLDFAHRNFLVARYLVVVPIHFCLTLRVY